MVRSFLQREFPDPWLVLEGHEMATLVERLEALGIVGGAVYDAFIAATARASGATLVTADRRAIRTYRLIGVDIEVLG